MRRFLPLIFLAVPALAAAQAAVRVEVRDSDGSSRDGRVSLTSETGQVATCETRGGSCVLSGVAGGRYVLRFEATEGGDPPEPRTVMIPPSGSVTLRVSSR